MWPGPGAASSCWLWKLELVVIFVSSLQAEPVGSCRVMALSCHGEIWAGKRRDPLGEHSSRSSLGFAFSPGTAIPRIVCSQKTPITAPVDVFDAQNPEHHTRAASPVIFCRSLFTPHEHMEVWEAQIPGKWSFQEGNVPFPGIPEHGWGVPGCL